jgi:plastocyanin
MKRQEAWSVSRSDGVLRGIGGLRRIRMDSLLRRGSPVLALAFVLAACSGNPASAAPVAPVPSGVIALEAKEYSFTPAAITIPAGSSTFSVRNTGREPHEFEVLSGDQSLGKAPAFAVGVTGALTVTLAAGGYTFACRLNGHDQLGMTGTLTVTGG